MKVASILLTIASLALASPIVKRADDISARENEARGGKPKPKPEPSYSDYGDYDYKTYGEYGDYPDTYKSYGSYDY